MSILPFFLVETNVSAKDVKYFKIWDESLSGAKICPGWLKMLCLENAKMKSPKLSKTPKTTMKSPKDENAKMKSPKIENAKTKSPKNLKTPKVDDHHLFLLTARRAFGL